ncbi:MAG: sulfurtransferase [Rhodobacteraceae bacterium]|uniref:rhodanese-like domain-containing protein n=1 Tax=Thioclava sp. L04-15 TaxID=1915318 RepID=UPI000998896E|nr:rhodanese-like domain-containing protein [Thioclava sp. L04-15]OOY26731.1 sulfurtransferase [Thioclava sp. L04-15]TNE91811.1 MAG: sulfurtransferase [Paracoccaceae bacterium]TNF16292.1 MAG: sulfurtransferase [Paracoccaceae bacterium]
MLNFLRPSAHGGRVERINPKDAVAKAKAGELTVIDVREGMEVKSSGKAKGALHIPLATIRMKADPSSPEKDPKLDTAKPVALYCASGARSAGAAQMLAQMGYEHVYNIGGLYDWHAAGGEIER